MIVGPNPAMMSGPGARMMAQGYGGMSGPGPNYAMSGALGDGMPPGAVYSTGPGGMSFLSLFNVSYFGFRT